MTIGAFALWSLTGILIFFHLDTGLHKVAHQWLSRVLIASVGLPVTSNVSAFRRYLAQTRARGLIGGALVLRVGSFLPIGGASGEPPFMAAAKPLAASAVATAGG